MLVVLVTHLGDRHLAVPLCEHIRRLGGVKTHECLIVSPHSAPLQGIEDVLRGAFGQVYVHRYADSMKGWPYGANEAAEVAMMHVAANPALRYHYLMLEPDCVPTTPEWLNRIDADYRRAGGGVMGVSIDTQEMAPPHRVVGRHVIGVAVYPKNFAQLCPLVRGLSAMSLGYQAQNIMAPPWDAYIGGYTTRMLTGTTLIQHLARQMFQTPNGLKFDCPSLEHALKQVSGDAVLIHGCKNPDFLAEIVNRYNLYAPEKRNGQFESERGGDAPRPVVPESRQEARQSDREPDGGGRSLQREPQAQVAETPPRIVLPPPLEKCKTKEEKMRRRAYDKLLKAKKEFGWDAMPYTPEWDRSHFLQFKMEWKDLRQYGSRLGVFKVNMTRAKLVNTVVATEREQRKEPWTKDLPSLTLLTEKKQEAQGASGVHIPAEGGALPPPATPDIPVEAAPPIPPGSLPASQAGLQTTVAWGSVTEDGVPVDDRPAEIGPSMEQKMRALMARRMAQG